LAFHADSDQDTRGGDELPVPRRPFPFPGKSAIALLTALRTSTYSMASALRWPY
jgi:hypothetical protein